MENTDQTTSTLAITKADSVIIVDELVVDQGEFKIVQLSDIRISKTNRKHFDELKLTEIAASIKEMGVAQPILIRPVTPTAVEPEPYEIVAGERRYRGSIIAGRTTIPAMVRVLTDLQAAKIQILENLQREDPHPLEEAEGYENLMLTHGYTSEQLVEELKKSRSYIYGRLKLCSLALGVREQFLNNKFPASTALLIARIPVPELQVKAVKEITEPQYNGEPMSYRAAANHLQNRYMLKLDDAPFPINDIKLLAIAGTCSKCPKRSGNQPEIFTDVNNQNLCTDPDCFGEKRAANEARKITLANKNGIPVLEGDEAKKKNYELLSTGRDCAFVSEESFLWSFARRGSDLSGNSTIEKELKEDQRPAPLCLIKLDNGKVKTIYSKSEMQTALEKAGLCLTEEMAKQADDDGDGDEPVKQNDAYIERCKREDENKQKAEKETTFRVALYKKLRQKGFAGFSLESLREFVKMMVVNDNSYAIPDDLLTDVYPFEKASDENVCTHIDQASVEDVQMILVDLVVGECLSVSHWNINDIADDEEDPFRTVQKMAELEGIDVEQVRQSLKAPIVVESKIQIEDVVLAKLIKAKKAKPAPVVTGEITGETTAEVIAQLTKPPAQKAKPRIKPEPDQPKKINAAEPWPFPTQNDAKATA